MSDKVNHLSRVTIECALKVYTELGPGLLESVYETCLAYELTRHGQSVRRQVRLPIQYGELKLNAALRLDLLVGDALIVEIKAVDALTPVHEAQLLTYLKLTGHRLGLLINFNVASLKRGIRRLIR